MNNQNHRGSTMLPYPVIAVAVGGNVDAINAVLKHFEKYILALSSRQLHDEYGNSFAFVDEEAKRRLETKLITKILTFNVA